MSVALHIVVIHGPNLNRLGLREPHIYGSVTLDMIHHELQEKAQNQGMQCTTFQSNHEGALIDFIHTLTDPNMRLILNAGGLTHTSVALRDALLSVSVPFIEVHVSNTYARESFRHHSYLSDIARGVILGLGPQVYSMAFDAWVALS